MRRTAPLYLFVLFSSFRLFADQASFSIQGTLREVTIERTLEGDSVPGHVALDTQVDKGAVRVLCDDSSSPACLGLYAARSTPAGCDYPNLPASTQAALTSLFGGCTLSCWIQTGDPSDFAFFREIWSCQSEQDLPCVVISGTILGAWLDSLVPLTTIQNQGRVDSFGVCGASKPHR